LRGQLTHSRFTVLVQGTIYVQMHVPSYELFALNRKPVVNIHLTE
jgi:hypothetical protein